MFTTFAALLLGATLVALVGQYLIRYYFRAKQRFTNDLFQTKDQ